MIYVKCRGRLGNQLFYYAFARSLQMKYPHYGEICLINEKRNYEKWGGMTILDFNINIKSCINRESISVLQKIADISFKIIRKIGTKFDSNFNEKFTIKMQPHLNHIGLYCMVGSKACELEDSKSSNAWVTGIWENPIYFNNIKDILLSELKPKHLILDHNTSLYNKILNTNSVCLSIRKGDFLNKGNENFNVCTEKYYYSALKIMKEKIGNYSLYIFSDDIEWCRKNMLFKESIEVEFEQNEGNDPVWEKIRIMSACKHFIISNSTFSWWAQYLATYSNKVVIAPRPWRVNEYCDDLYDKSFILLNGTSGKIESIF